ncbi:MAG TPA: glucose-1-phosphate thymidylyltransferase [Bacillota bacterium]|nr:glucose-1-phosphate thymidylyltransferase [Bacillota bacterium]HQD41307.1 glucose-1-phosphate thymidylyltransferase [Bacillota bacterium]
MKGLILCGGKGTRLRPFTFTGAKHFLPVANKPVIYYIIESLKRAGIEDICVVVGDREEEFQHRLGDGSSWGVSISYIRQHAPLGLAHGVKVSEHHLKGETFVIILGDNLIMHPVEDLVRHHMDTGARSTILLSRVEDPRRFGIALIDNGKITGLVEKPKEPVGNHAIVGMYVFDSSIFDVIDRIKPSPRGELELTDAIMELIRDGLPVSYLITKGWWSDVGRPKDLLRANRRILADLVGDVKGHVDANSTVGKKVVIGEGTVVMDSVIEDFVTIGSNVVLKKCRIGSYTSVGDGSSVMGTDIRNSIIMEDCILENVGCAVDMSIIGQGSAVKKNKYPDRISLWIGRDSKIYGV